MGLKWLVCVRCNWSPRARSRPLECSAASPSAPHISRNERKIVLFAMASDILQRRVETLLIDRHSCLAMAVVISLHSPLLPEVNCVVILALSSNLLYQRPVDRSSGRTTDAARQVLFERLLLELTNLDSHAEDYALRSGGVKAIPNSCHGL